MTIFSEKLLSLLENVSRRNAVTEAFLIHLSEEVKLAGMLSLTYFFLEKFGMIHFLEGNLSQQMKFFKKTPLEHHLFEFCHVLIFLVQLMNLLLSSLCFFIAEAVGRPKMSRKELREIYEEQMQGSFWLWILVLALSSSLAFATHSTNTLLLDVNELLSIFSISLFFVLTFASFCSLKFILNSKMAQQLSVLLCSLNIIHLLSHYLFGGHMRILSVARCFLSLIFLLNFLPSVTLEHFRHRSKGEKDKAKKE